MGQCALAEVISAAKLHHHLVRGRVRGRGRVRVGVRARVGVRFRVRARSCLPTWPLLSETHCTCPSSMT